MEGRTEKEGVAQLEEGRIETVGNRKEKGREQSKRRREGRTGEERGGKGKGRGRRRAEKGRGGRAFDGGLGRRTKQRIPPLGTERRGEGKGRRERREKKRRGRERGRERQKTTANQRREGEGRECGKGPLKGGQSHGVLLSRPSEERRGREGRQRSPSAPPSQRGGGRT